MKNKALAQKFASYPAAIRPKMEALRKLIFTVAAEDEAIGPLEESLKWGEPAYTTRASKSGTSIRIDWKPKSPDQYALYVNCQTTLVERYKILFPELNYQGNRAIVFDLSQPLPEPAVRLCIAMALRYHLDKK